MFSIIISEKGGAERKESFDKSEINVGRVQGNDLMLPKGNVSKHHARLLFRDGRFIVTDLKSTNGTYVNGRKIAQATIVREGDKIYIGDFVLRLDANGQSDQVDAATASPAGEDESIRTLARDNARAAAPNAPAVTLKAPTHPPGAPLPRPMPQNVSTASPPAAPAGSPSAGASVAQNFPLDQDPDDSAPIKPRVPSVAPPPPPLAGGGIRPMTMPLNPMAPPIIGQRPSQGSSAGAPPVPSASAVAPPAPRVDAPAPPAPSAPMAMPPVPSAPIAPPPVPSAPIAVPPAPVAAPPAPAPVPAAALGTSAQAPAAAPPHRPTAPPPRIPPKEPPAQAARRLAVTMLIGRIAEVVDLSALRANPIVTDELSARIERAAREQASAMRDEGEAPQDVDLEAILRETQRELVGLGPIGPLLDDDDVAEIHCGRFDQILTVRGSGSVSNEGAGFSSEEAFQRVIARLAHQSGHGWAAGETVVERKLARASFIAVAPPSAASHVLTIRKRWRAEASLEELTRTNVLSKPMAQFLEACVAAHANVLVAGVSASSLLSALGGASASGERVCVVQHAEEIAVSGAHVVALSAVEGKAGADAVQAAVRLGPSRLVVTRLAGPVASATLEAMTAGSPGVLAAIAAPSLRQGLSRLVAQLVLDRPGLGIDDVREIVGDAFDIAVEAITLADGRIRVTKIAELGVEGSKGLVARDLFAFTADASGNDGTFASTGVIPRIVNDLAARGTKLDPGLFKRGGR